VKHALLFIQKGLVHLFYGDSSDTPFSVMSQSIDHLSSRDDEDPATTLICRYVVGVCLEMVSYRESNSFGTGTQPIKTNRRGEPECRVFTLRRDVKVDCRDAVRSYCRGVSPNAPSVQSLVRGHWKRQAHGPGYEQRKFIFVEPYWRGPEDGPIAMRAHSLGQGSSQTGSVVYFLQQGEDGPIKTGSTTKLGARIATLQTASSVELKVLGTCVGDNTVERAIHRRFKHLRIRGEWFRPEAELLEFIRSVGGAEGSM
jgi:hypothetical protein